MNNIIAEIAAERARQISVEGWTPEHDDEHGNGELAMAASAYAFAAGKPLDEHWRNVWTAQWRPQMSDAVLEAMKKAARDAFRDDGFRDGDGIVRAALRAAEAMGAKLVMEEATVAMIMIAREQDPEGLGYSDIWRFMFRAAPSLTGGSDSWRFK